MQNRYVGDIGDYGKYGLLRHITKGLTLGVNWYLSPDESHNADGKHTTYLDNNRDRKYDSELYDTLKEIVRSGNRNVRQIQNTSVLPKGTIFYDRVLDFSNNQKQSTRQEHRQAWHIEALKELQSCDVVFLDPDNGLEVKRVSLTDPKGNKYIGKDEIKDYCLRGKSVIFYNHRARKPENEYLAKFQSLKENFALNGFIWFGLKYVRGTIRDYIFIIHPDHDSIIFKVDEFLKTNWSSVFSKLDFSTSYHQIKPFKESVMKKSSTSPGYVNKNNQMNMGKTDIPGTDHGQWFYQIKCQECGHGYLANGTDIWQRKCPNCQGGKK